jgi:D-alanyl-lipoteichoic acid acyltransferase DltB (MBOAT superfamily)
LLFNSVTYLFVFLPLVVICWWHAGQRLRLWLVLVASLIFYGFWRVEFVPLLLASAVIDYWISLRIAREENEARRRLWLWISLAVNLTILGFFKYLAFFADTVFSVAEWLGFTPGFFELNILLPLGISFYIFQTMSYTVDVYRRDIEPERDLLAYTCFVVYFPQLVAGPILRAPVLIPQLKRRIDIDWALIADGIERIVAGLFLKVVLADTIAGFVDEGFAVPAANLSALDAWTLAFLFGFQIYFDFAGYSHIAIGSAKLMGIDIPENFNFPYAATSPRDFWRRWHISLSTWIRDYLYVPLTGSKALSQKVAWDTQGDAAAVPQARRTRALYTTWAIMGLWHGANWTFVLWGLYHAAMVHLHRLIAPRIPDFAGALQAPLAIAVTLPLMMAGWIPFRAQTVSDALTLWATMFNPFAYDALRLAPNSYLLAAAMLAAVTLRYLWAAKARELVIDFGAARIGLGAAYHAATLAAVFVFLQAKQQFIYFQF